MFGRFVTVSVIFAGVLFVGALVQAGESTGDGSSQAGKSWIFDQGLYTSDRKTGERVWQFAAPKPVYRDPNALFDSPHGPFPFEPDVYDPYLFYSPYLYYGAPWHSPTPFFVTPPLSYSSDL